MATTVKRPTEKAPMIPAVEQMNIAPSPGDEAAAKRPIEAAAASGSVVNAPCFHCGEPCRTGAFTQEGRHFCCPGCQTVFALLADSGLERFYDLATTPGTRVKRTPMLRQWSFLDDVAVEERLLDFADQKRARVTLYLPAIHCVACVWLLENLFRLQEGIGESRVNFTRREVSVTFERAIVKLSRLAELLTSLGYEPALTFGALDSGKSRETPAWRRRQWLQIGVAGFGFGNLMLLALPGYLGLDSLSGPWFKTLAGWLSLALALPVLVYSAADYWRAAWLCLRRRMLSLDVPIALGLASIYGRSVFEVATGRGEGYGDSLTGLIFFLLCGRLFQRKTFDRLAFDRDYKGFFPLSVLRKKAGREESVAISQLAVGDRLVIRHGELIPADAKLISGEALVDYSFVTGESQPAKVGAGQNLFAGGRQVAGVIEIETFKPVSESYLTSLWNSAVFRKKSDDDLDSQTNQYSRRFTLLVIGVAIAAAVFWVFVDASVALNAFTSVLIVACPCALALAAPLTLGTAQRLLAGRRVFLRNAQVVERMATAETVVFDKTGTLTSPGAGAAKWSGTPLSEAERSWLRALAGHSAHPLAARICEAVRPAGTMAVESFGETPGSGMEGRVGGREIAMGSAAWLRTRGARSGTSEADPLSLEGGSVHVAIDGLHRGCFTVQSELRPEMETLLRRLRGCYQLVLLSGDNARDAARFQALLGGQAHVKFNQSPFDKLRVIGELQSAGCRVMMVGDGLNDAGALKQADVGVAVVENVGTFSPASDVILDAAQLPSLAAVLAFSKRAARVVRAGFLVSGLYNLVGVSIAAAGLLSPLVCAVLMPVSSGTVALFAMGATRWMARRSFDSGSQREEPLTAEAASVNFLTPAATEAAP
ncbi:MAG: heavy metal translocating P-type ATPase metal-binding domain-containing protein [Verrucomicrobia bacterium]|nr:heavy metal translocating P-type ATPase metal-binding domain-containing protein [Verrucomicrobiota bacterium]